MNFQRYLEMGLNLHPELEDKHAMLGGSKYQYLTVSDDKFENYVRQLVLADYQKLIGTRLHEYAASHIEHGCKIQKTDKHNVLWYLLDSGIPREVIDIDWYFGNLMNYTNDCITFRMIPEVKLKYSYHANGAADGFYTNPQHSVLRISDYKSGKKPASMNQLLIYTADFCLEYGVTPGQLEFCELRIYQRIMDEELSDKKNGIVVYKDNIDIFNPTPEDILPAIDRIIRGSDIITEMVKRG